jgi:hypothetical protein
MFVARYALLCLDSILTMAFWTQCKGHLPRIDWNGLPHWGSALTSDSKVRFIDVAMETPEGKSATSTF